MLKTIFKIVLLTLLLSVLLLGIFRNSIIKNYLTRYIAKNLKADCRIEKVNLTFDSFKIENLKVKSSIFEADVKEVFIQFSPLDFKNKKFIKNITISGFNMRLEGFQVAGFELKKHYKNLYSLKIDGVWIHDKKFSNFLIPIKAQAKGIVFPKAKNPFLGSLGYMSVAVDINSYEDVFLLAKFDNISFEKIVDAFAHEDAAMSGLFSGKINAHFTKSGISLLKGDFVNKDRGLINIKKESSLAFLKSYLDTASYRALIDNFKNYEYNIGVVTLKNENSALSLNLDFTSDAMGKRNITINFHEILGGVK